MKAILIVLILLTASVASAQPADILIAASDTTLSFTASDAETAPRVFDLAWNGDASITFYWINHTGALGLRRDSVKKQAIYYLRAAYPPRHLSFTGAGPDSASIDQVTATAGVITVNP